MKKILSALVAVAFLASPALADDKAAPAPAKVQKAEKPEKAKKEGSAKKDKGQKKSKDEKKGSEDHSGHGHDSKPAAPAPSKEAK